MGKKAYEKESKWYSTAKISIFKNYTAKLIQKFIGRQMNGMIDFDKLKDTKGRPLIKLSREEK